MSFMIDDIDYIQQVYRELKAEVDEVEMEFENTVRVYRSPLRQALNDITRLYNSVNNVKGDFSGLKKCLSLCARDRIERGRFYQKCEESGSTRRCNYA
ncbi:hypothetical protein K6959_07755 [Bacillus aquiflavi]|uniref:hypothetical protein n=1 Tax=Bacillus aquiflavi TaxID=2672567 RepID=UPI001CA839ED|nr:hypothetical protein [Bacillus aquiflavi]UAC49681.1 hypothetical protein K6959_07755 [Bacillus aquiflavi]